jgi:S-(hydroxymethyl)glutathione dehydrogenase/alcohol dehydrogenase
MKAAVLYEPNTPLVIEELDLDEPGPGEVLVKTMASGVCHSDWHVVKGDWNRIPLPTILGHESSGVVEAVGPGVSSLEPGDHVVLTWKAGCGRCEMCQQGWLSVCDLMPSVPSKPRVRGTGAEINQMIGLGSFGSYTVVPETAAVRVDRDIPFAQAALVGCGVSAGVGAAINTARVRPGTSVAVFGCGGVGLNCIQGSAIAGATTIIAVDLLDQKLDFAREFGATHTVNASREDPVERIIELTGGVGAHYAFEAIGLVEKPFVQSIMCTRKRGVTVWVGAAPTDTPVTIDAMALFYEKTVMGSYLGSTRPHIDIPRLLSMYKAGALKLDELITRTFPVEEINSAFEALSRGEVARGVIVFD